MLLPTIPEAALWAIYFAPLLSFAVATLLIGSRRPLDAGRMTVLAVGVSWLLALWALDSSLAVDGEALDIAPHNWVSLFNLVVPVGVRLDGLTAIMLVVVTSVSLLVQVYSTGYMRGDHGYARYFAYMSLFTAAMLGLVLSSSLLQLFVHWELVGLSSYLLIGFWFHRPAAAAAAKKAFIVTRFGDFGFLVGLLLIWSKTGEFDIAAINALAPTLSAAVLTGFTLGLLAGAVGKSAQFPLHIWLPDAMEGPTPVSALIHAATMVVAGVYLIARFFPAFEAAPAEVRDVVAYTGGFTALLAASMGLAATDIKRVLAYSTISQLGYMVMALGLGGYVAAIFHLFTHAFFKAMLFLGAGSVNHATNSFDLRRMGGLRLAMPVTFASFVIGSLSLAGVFPLAGFWSKDEILLDALHHNRLLFVAGVAVAGMTALYMFRAVYLTFFGAYRGGEAPAPGHGDGHAGAPHESPRTMWVPLAILTVPAVAAGWVNLGGGFGTLAEGALPAGLRTFEIEVDAVVVAASTLFTLGGIGLATAIYLYRRPAAELIRSRLGPLPRIVERKYYLDDLAETVVVRGLLNGVIGRALVLIDTQLVDRLANEVGRATRLAGDALRRSEAGQLQAYTSMFMLGVIVAAVAIFVLSGNVLER
ncbi:MAG: NADH-quinone oxidoreductase subunit L [Dehalococcoidia bacterium]|nr:NADH-quinone oxidoreductase subunit L [Dehalococcoidia bacterium]